MGHFFDMILSKEAVCNVLLAIDCSPSSNKHLVQLHAGLGKCVTPYKAQLSAGGWPGVCTGVIFWYIVYLSTEKR